MNPQELINKKKVDTLKINKQMKNLSWNIIIDLTKRSIEEHTDFFRINQFWSVLRKDFQHSIFESMNQKMNTVCSATEQKSEEEMNSIKKI